MYHFCLYTGCEGYSRVVFRLKIVIKGQINGKSLFVKKKTYLKAMFCFFCFLVASIFIPSLSSLSLIAPGKNNKIPTTESLWAGVEISFFGICSSPHDCYVHQFLDDYVDFRYRLYRLENNSGIALAPCICF